VKPKVIHIEIPADDTGRATEFYGELFGIEWQRPFEGEGPEYHMFGDQEEGYGGGLYPRQGADDDRIRVYFNTEDIDATLDRVRELGGSVDEEKNPVPSMGWYAHVRDPEGNKFSFWQSDENAPTPEGMTSGQASAS
jgi:predicted enzyme related to lactoylglutathione lyase